MALAPLHSAHAGLLQKTDPSHEVQLGREVAREVERKYPLSTDKAAQERVRRVGSALVEHLSPKRYPYEFKVLGVRDINAFCLPGGFMYVNEGLLNAMPDDDELAFVMAHEVAHASLRHWAKQTEKMETVGLIGTAVSIAVGDTSGGIAALAMGLMSLKYSRDDEEQADAAGLDYLWQAGFDTKGALDAMQVIANLEKGKSAPRYLRSHPPGTERLKHLQSLCDQLKTRPRPTPAPGEKTSPPELDLASIIGDVSGIQIARNPYFPMSVGNEWTYEVQASGGLSNYTVSIVSAIPVGDNAVYRAQTTFGKDVVVPCQLLATATEIWRRTKPTSPESPWTLDLVTGTPDQQPVTSGEWKYEILGDDRVATPSGTFDALKVRRSGSSGSPCDLWFAKGIGLVRRTCQDGKVTETLVKYKVSPTEPEPPASPEPPATPLPEAAENQPPPTPQPAETPPAQESNAPASPN